MAIMTHRHKINLAKVFINLIWWQLNFCVCVFLLFCFFYRRVFLSPPKIDGTGSGTMCVCMRTKPQSKTRDPYTYKTQAKFSIITNVYFKLTYLYKFFLSQWLFLCVFFFNLPIGRCESSSDFDGGKNVRWKVLPPVTYTEGIPEWMKLRIHSVYVQGVKHPVDVNRKTSVNFSFSLFSFLVPLVAGRHHHFCPSVRFGWLPPNVCVCMRLAGGRSCFLFLAPPPYLMCASVYIYINVCVGLYGWPIKGEKRRGQTRWLPFFFSFYSFVCVCVWSDEKINTLRGKHML